MNQSFAIAINCIEGRIKVSAILTSLLRYQCGRKPAKVKVSFVFLKL